MIKLNSSASYNELADEFWMLYNSNISDISDALEQAIDERGWGSDFFTENDDEPPATEEQYRTVLKATRRDISKLITGAVASVIDNATITRFGSDSLTIELDSMPDFSIELTIRPDFVEN